MKSKNFIAAVLSCALLSLLTVSAFAQLGRIEGEVVKAGTTEPVVNAAVSIVRMDIKGNYDLKTDKKGKFLHAGVPYAGNYTILVSADGFEPTFLGPGIRPTGDPIKIELRPGDGRKITIDDVRKLQAGGKGAPAAGGAAGGGTAPKVSAEEAKKAKEEYDKAVKEREEAEKYNSSITQINAKLKEGNDAMSQNNPAAAIAAFKEAVALNPSIHVSQGNLAIALQKRAVAEFNAGNKDAAKQDFLDSVAASTKALEGLDAQEKDTKMKNDPVQNKANRRTYLVVKAESESILGGKYLDGPQAAAAAKDYQAVADLTDDPAKKKDLAVKSAKVLFDAGQTEPAIAAYQKLLEADPANADAWYWLGMAYANAAKFKESADALQTFVEKAPNDPRAAEAKSVIAELVRGNNLPPPKSLDDGKRKAAPAKKKP